VVDDWLPSRDWDEESSINWSLTLGKFLANFAPDGEGGRTTIEGCGKSSITAARQEGAEEGGEY